MTGIKDRAALLAQISELRTKAHDLVRVADGLAASITAPAQDGAEWMTIRASGLPRTTARRLAREGTIVAKKVGREYLLSRASVSAYMAARDERETTDAEDLGRYLGVA